MLTKHINRSVLLWSGSLLLLVVVILVSLPLVIQTGIERTLNNLGAEQITLEEVDFNPFLGSILIQGLRAKTREFPPFQLDSASMEVSWTSLWRRRVVLETLTIQGLRLDVIQADQKPLTLSRLGATAGSQESQLSPWGVGIRKLHVENSDITLASSGLDLTMHIESLELTNLFSYAEAIPATVNLVGSLNGAPVKTSVKATLFSHPRYANGHVELQSLDITVFRSLFPDTMDAQTGKLSLDLMVHARQEDNDNYQVDINGQANIGKASLRLPNEEVSIRHKNLAWKGNIELARQLKVINWRVRGDITSSHTILLQELGSKQSPLLSANAIKLAGLDIDHSRNVVVDDIALTSVELNLKRRKDGSLQLPTGEPVTAESPTTKVKKEEEDETHHYRVNRLTIGGYSTVSFEDESVTPQFQQKIALNEFVLEKLDSVQQDKPSLINMKGSIGEYSKVSLSGDIYPFHEKLTMNLNGNIESLDLHPFTSYTLPTLGYDLESGHLNANVKIKLTQGIIDSEGDLKVKNLTMKPSDPEKMEKFEERLTMPLNTALSLLRDDKGLIKLKLPIEGDIDNPKFNLADAIRQSISKATKFTVMTYLKLALQPYGSYVAIAQMVDSAGKKINAIRLDPVAFNPGVSTLDEDNMHYLQSAIKLLNKHSKLDLKICGKAVLKDLGVLLKKNGEFEDIEDFEVRVIDKKEGVLLPKHEDQLLKLARKRSEKVKNYLVTEGGVQAGRLFICHPEIDENEEAVARVELVI